MPEAAAEKPRYEIRPDWHFPTVEMTVAADRQRELHGYCDIPRERWGDLVDPTFLARHPIKVIGNALFACHPERGYVHMVHRIRQFLPVRLGEPVTVSGRFTAVDPVPRGWMMKAAFDYRLGDGRLAMTVEPEALMADPTRMPPPGERKPRAAGSAAGDANAAAFSVLTRKQLTPEKVLGYCGDTDNRIHTDPDYARGFGFRAPIAAGNQIVNLLLEALALEGAPERIDVEIRFLRPVFWDEAIAVAGRRGADGRVIELRALKADGKIASSCAVRPPA